MNITDTVALYLLSSGLIVNAVIMTVRSGFRKAEEKVAEVLPAQDAVKVNEALDAIEKITEAVVQDTNARVVIGLKANGLFTKETAESVKAAAIQDVLVNLGPLKEKAAELVGPLENIIGTFIEKHVLSNKKQQTPA